MLAWSCDWWMPDGLRAALFAFLKWGALWLGSLWAFAGDVVGVVTDAVRSERVTGAVVQVAVGSEAVSATTDRLGRFRLVGLGPGPVSLTVSMPGYHPMQLALDVPADGVVRRDVALMPEEAVYHIEVVSASREKEAAFEAPVSVSEVSAEAFVQDVTGNAAGTLRQVRGVDVTPVGLDRFQVSLRGFNSTFVGGAYVLIDHREGSSASLGANFFGTMPLAAIDLARAEVVRGPGAALYGQGVDQGLVHFMTKNPFDYPGTTFSSALGEQNMQQLALRHASVLNDRWAFKVVAQGMQGDDWELDPDHPEDAAIIDQMLPSLAPRDADVHHVFGSGELVYRPNSETEVTFATGASKVKHVFLGNSGEFQNDGGGTWYTQLRLRAGNFFGQIYRNKNLEGDSFSYRSGLRTVDTSQQLSALGQYSWDLEGQRRLTVGFDVSQTEPETEGTVHGRFEDMDEIAEAGLYAQIAAPLGPQWDVLAALRGDWNDLTEDTEISPRLAVKWKPDARQRVRLSYNRAFRMPPPVSYFTDLSISSGPPFSLIAQGGFDPFTFDEPLQTSSFLDPNLRYQGIGMPLDLAYQLALQGLVDAGAFDGVPAPSRDALLALLATRQLGGFSQGVLLHNNQQIAAPQNINALEPTVTRTFELGYKGQFRRWSLEWDVYHTRRASFISDLQPINPLVLAPQTSRDLSMAVAAAFNQEELAAFGLNPQTLAAMFSAAAGTLDTHPVGLVEPDGYQRNGIYPNLILAIVNFGQIDYFGSDWEWHWRPNHRWLITQTGFFLNDTFFTSEEAGEEARGLFTAANAPKWRLMGGVSFESGSGWGVRAAARYSDAYQAFSGVHRGHVPAVTLLDVGASYRMMTRGGVLRFDLSVQNLADEDHRFFPDAPRLGRMSALRVVYEF